MKALHELDAQGVNDLLRPDLQREHEDEPVTNPAIPDLNAQIRYIFGGHGW